MILKVFFLGMAATLPAALIELGFAEKLSELSLPPFFLEILYVFIGVALVEEAVKYLVVKKRVLKDPEFDEPLDVMLYMVIAALGFAALENLLVLFPLLNPFQLFETVVVSSFRFVGATFLHALCSGLLGYFLALSFFNPKNRFKMLGLGLFTVMLLHGLYNFSIMKIEGNLKFILPIIILISLALFVSLGFKKLKKLKSVCKIT